MNISRLLGATFAAAQVVICVQAQTPAPELDLPRPGIVQVTDTTGEAMAVTGDQKKKLKPDDRVRIGSSLTTGRRSMLTLAFSNGVSVQLGAEAEVEIEEFGQSPTSISGKFSELKAEPTLSRTRLKLVRGDVTVTVKPLKVSRGSSFVLATPAGNLRTGEGTFRALVQMHDLGLGIESLDMQSGSVEFEAVGGNGYAPLPAGQKFAFALEVDKATGAIKVGEMPKEAPKAKR